MRPSATEVAFHFGAPDKLAYAVRLLRKAVGAGARVVVVADTEMLHRLDAALWASAATDFVAHCFTSAPAQVRALSPVLLADDGIGPEEHVPGVLVNLGDAVPVAFERHARVIELVSTDETDRALAGPRWKSYAERGFSIVRHDLQLRS